MKVKCISFCIGLLCLTGSVAADFPRLYDVIVLKGENLGAFLQDPVDQIRIYAYHSALDSWSPVVMQVDELDGGTSCFGSKNGVLDPTDEVLFSSWELGDQAEVSEWPSTGDTLRQEVAVIDPHSGSTGYVYVFLSSSLPAALTEWISVSNDTIYGETYTMAHDSSYSSGLPAMLKIGESDVDFLDKWRFQLKVTKIKVNYQGQTIDLDNQLYITESINKTYSIKWGGIPLGNLTIKSYQHGQPQITGGPVRITRQVNVRVSFKGLSMDSDADLPILIQYYPYNTEFAPDFNIEFPSDIKNLEGPFIEFSKAFNDQSLQMRFHGYDYDYKLTQTTDDNIINDNSLDIFDHEIDTTEWQDPDSLWYGFSGNSASLVDQVSSLHMFVPLNRYPTTRDRPHVLFYFDKKVNGDYGYEDYQVFGVNGLRIQDWQVQTNDTLNLGGRFLDYYFPGNKNTAELASLYEQQRQPLQTVSSEQERDDTPPAFVEDLRIQDVTDTSVVLAWTAPGDDGMTNGPVSQYYIRYNDTPPAENKMGAGENDWTWWSASAPFTFQLTTDLKAPGETQTFTINGLQTAVIYYFRVRPGDESGNWASLSNTAVQSTTPVELVSFDTEVDKNNIHLEWTTASESNNLGFQVQRRQLNSPIWKNLQFIKGQGTTLKPVYYAYTDENVEAGHYQYRLKQMDTDGAFTYSQILTVKVTAPERFVLHQNYPNPFNPETVIQYEIPDAAAGQITLIIYDMLGRKVRMLQRKEQAGYHQFEWDGTHSSGEQVSSGIYFYTLKAGSFVETRKMIKIQ